MKKFIVYKSSAGSGKTFTLVKEYLKLALSDSFTPPKTYKSILAITFTNKAAAEMKDRILVSLKELSKDTFPDKIKTLASLLCAELAIDEAELKKRSTSLLYDILHNYGNFGISTIDSFTHSIIRNFSHDIDLPVNFNIETNEDETIVKCIDQLISKIGEDEALTQLVLEFSRSQTEEQKSWQVDENIKSFVGKALKNSASEKLSLLKDFSIEDFKTIRKELIAKNKAIEAVLIDIADKFYSLISSNGINEGDFFQGARGVPGFFKKLKEKNFVEDGLHGSYVLSTINENKWSGPKTSKSTEASIIGLSDEIRNLYYKASAHIEKHLSDYIINQNVLKNLYSLSLINEIEKLITEFKQEENILFISEFNKRIADIISNEPVPFIYEKIGERYKHFLIDEFQDTSSMQWQNLLPLIDNSLAEGYFNLIVGDGKQSIYRWRGGEAEQFEALPHLPYIKNEEMKEIWEDTLQRNSEIKTLENNFRSLKNIIEFNNDFFKSLSSEQLKDRWLSIYSTIEQIPQEKNQGGLVTIDIVEKDEESDLALSHMLNYIHASAASGYRFSEIVILVRNNYEGDTVADFLTQQNIPVISSDALLLKNCDEVAFIIDVLRFLNQTNNAICASSIICYLCDNNIVSKSKDELLLLLNKGVIKYNLIKLLQQENITLDLEKLVTMPLLECCIAIINCFSINKNKNYLQFFLDEIIAYTAFNSNSISAFLEFWERRGDSASLKIPDGSEAVRIMTIHKSKGLEFPVVILPFCNWTINKPDFLWLDSDNELPMVILNMSKELSKTKYSKEFEEEQQKQMLDNINILYVAFTRAANHLHIISKEPKAAKQDIYQFVRNYMSKKLNLPANEKHATIGEPSINKHAKPDTAVFTYQLNVNNWNRVISIKENNDLLYGSQINESKETGVLVHYILSKIKSKKDIATAIQQCEQEGLFTSNDVNEISKELYELIDTPAISKFFEDTCESVNEQEIIAKNGKVLRPDRLLLKNNEATIVDFKTGKKLSSYDEQLNDYANALMELGYTKVNKYLVYVKEREVVEVV